jgi:cytidylate kinase
LDATPKVGQAVDEARQAGGATPQAMRAITISRLYGSGGGEIATLLARRLEWHLIDHEVVARVARTLGITQEEAEERDEHVESLVSRLISSMALAYPTVSVDVPPAALPKFQMQAYQEALRRVILAAADEGQAVIVGRGGQSLLRGRRDVLRVLIVASSEARVRYVARREGIDEAAARKRIEQKDRDRLRYVQETYRHHALDPVLYDLTVNTDVLALQNVVDLVCRALELKGSRLGVAEDHLGPAAELGGYPGRAADLPTPTDVGTPSK